MRPKLIHVTTFDVSAALLLRSQLRRFAEAGFDVLVVSSPGAFAHELSSPGVRHVPVGSLAAPLSPDGGLRAAAALVRLFRSERPAVVHSHDPGSAFAVGLAARVSRVPAIVQTVHGPSEQPALEPTSRPLRADRAPLLAHHILFQTETQFRSAVRRRRGMRDRSSWIGSGVDVDRFSPGKVDGGRVAALRTRWGCGAHGRVVGTLRLPGNAPAPFTGEKHGPLDGAISVVASLGGSEHASVTPEGAVLVGVSPDELPTVVAAFDVFVLSFDRTALPRWALEAAAMERPVVVEGGPEEAARKDLQGVAVRPVGAETPGRALARVIASPAAAAALGKAARVRVEERFNEAAAAERSVQVYRLLLKRHRIRWDGERADL